MAYYDALIAKWAALTGTTEEKLSAINALTVAGPPQLVPIANIMAYLRANNLWLPIKANALSASPNPAAEAWLDLNQDLRAEHIDMTLAVWGAGLGALVQAGLLTQEQANAISAMGTTTVSWCEANGYPFIDAGRGNLGGGDLAAAGGLA